MFIQFIPSSPMKKLQVDQVLFKCGLFGAEAVSFECGNMSKPPE